MATEYCVVATTLCLSAEAWAAWVQAIGSVLAIVVTVAVVEWQHRRANRARREDRRRDLEQYIEAVGECDQLVRAIEKAATSGRVMASMQAGLDAKWGEALEILDVVTNKVDSPRTRILLRRAAVTFRRMRNDLPRDFLALESQEHRGNLGPVDPHVNAADLLAQLNAAHLALVADLERDGAAG
jgi:hypothetical protein